MPIKSRDIKVNIDKGSVSKSIEDTLATLRKGTISLKVDLETSANLKSTIDSLEKLKGPTLDIAGFDSQLKQLDKSLEEFHRRAQKSLNLEIKISGLDKLDQQMKAIQQVTQGAANAATQYGNNMQAAGTKTSAATRTAQRNLEKANKELNQYQSTVGTYTVNGVNVRPFKVSEIESGKADRIQQKATAAGVDITRVIPGARATARTIDPDLALSKARKEQRKKERLEENARKAQEAFDIKQEEDLRRAQEKQARDAQRAADKAVRDAAIEQKRFLGLGSRAARAGFDPIFAGLGQSTEVQESLARIGSAQSAALQDPDAVAQLLLSSTVSRDKLATQFSERFSAKEFFAGITGGDEARRRIRESDALKFAEKNPAVFGLKERLVADAQTGALPKLLSGQKLLEKDALTQIAFGGVFGGRFGGGLGAAGGIAAGTLGAVVNGAPGALFATTLFQTGAELISPFIDGIKEKQREFEEAGEAYQGSILSISAALQQATDLVDSRGNVSGAGTIGAQIRFQEKEAERIQLSARSKLLPLGIGGQTEATFVRGIIAALGQRGISASADEIGQIAERLGGVIQTQRPQLLENTSLLNRDLQDVLSGLPQAQRTVLGSLVRGSLGNIARARSGADIVAALEPQAAFSQVARESNNPVAVRNRLKGAEDQLSTVGGKILTEAVTPALNELAKTLSSPSVIGAAEELGRTFGGLSVTGIQLSRGATILAANLGGPFLSVLNQATGGLVSLARAIPVVGPQIEAAEKDQKVQDAIDQVQVSRSKVKASVQIQNALETVGLKDPVEEFGVGLLRNPTAQLATIRSLRARFGDTPEFQEKSAALANQEVGLLESQFNSRFSGFTSPQEIRQKERFRRSELIPQQLSAQGRVVGGLQSQLEKTQQEIADAQGRGPGIDRQIALLQGAFNAERANLRGGQLSGDENLQNLVNSSQIQSQITALQEQKKQDAITLSQGDAQVQGLVSAIVDAEEKILELKNQQLASAEKEAQIIAQRQSLVKQGFDASTPTGAKLQGEELLRTLARKEENLSERFSRLDDELQQLAETIRLVEQRINTPGIGVEERKQRIDQLNTLRAKGKALNERREDLKLEANPIVSEQLAAERQVLTSSNRGIELRQLGVDSFTLAGKSLNNKLSTQSTLTDLRADQKLAGGLQRAISENPDSVLADAQRIALEGVQGRIGGGFKKLAELRRDSTNIGFDQRANAIDLQEALRKSAKAIEEENQKRQKLNDALTDSTSRLEAFGSRADATIASQEERLISSAQSAAEQGIGVPEFLLTEEFRQEVRTRAAQSRFNTAAEPFGLSRSGVSLNSGLAGLGTNLRTQLDNEQVKLRTAVENATKALENLPLELEKASLARDRDLFNLSAKNGPAEPRTAGRAPRVPGAPPNPLSLPGTLAGEGAGSDASGTVPGTSPGFRGSRSISTDDNGTVPGFRINGNTVPLPGSSSRYDGNVPGFTIDGKPVKRKSDPQPGDPDYKDFIRNGGNILRNRGSADSGTQTHTFGQYGVPGLRALDVFEDVEPKLGPPARKFGKEDPFTTLGTGLILGSISDPGAQPLTPTPSNQGRSVAAVAAGQAPIEAITKAMEAMNSKLESLTSTVTTLISKPVFTLSEASLGNSVQQAINGI